MLGLGDYRSSDEEEGPPRAKALIALAQHVSQKASRLPEAGEVNAQGAGIEDQQDTPEATTAYQPRDGATLGPALGPSRASAEGSTVADEALSAPPSPYSSTKLLVRNLTMPPVPNFDIPDSPPGSPAQSSTAKFARFLELKKQGIHFNEKLEKSSALKNPSLLQKLMDFAGIDEQDQYASTSPADLAVPTSLPAWAYAEELAKTQQEILKKREEEKARTQREAVEFVSATASAGSSRGTTPATAGKGLRGSAAERVMAGLNRDKPRSPLIQDGGKGKETDRRRPSSRFDVVSSGHRSRSRSPQRRRDRSR